MTVTDNSNVIRISGKYTADEFAFVSSALHRIVEKQGYQDVSLDFKDCEKAYSFAMLPICASALNLWKAGIDVHLILPQDRSLKNLFQNTNWAYFIDPRSNQESHYRGYTHSPAQRFTNGTEQNSIVNRAMDVLLAAVKNLTRDELRYLEWAINELTDNVINHAQSPCGGLLQMTNHRKSREIEIVVADGGLGIPNTLKAALPPKHTDAEILQQAIRENVTRDKNAGQGNGLYGSWRISQISGGMFSIHSNLGRLESPEIGDVRCSNSNIPIKGTIVRARIGYSRKVDLSSVMVFPDRSLSSTDYIETHFLEDDAGNIVFDLASESDGYGSRTAAFPVRRKLENILAQIESTVVIEMNDVNFVSSSYADELFGKLFVSLGPLLFMQRLVLKNVDPLVRKLIDRAITQRTTQGLS